MQKIFYLLFLLCPTLSEAQKNTLTPIVANSQTAVAQTEQGQIRGFIHQNTYIYKGISYGQATRFMPATPPKPWQGIRTAMAYGPVCPTDPVSVNNDELEFAFDHNWGYSSEDCFRLNIWTPNISDTKKRPVMVWLHGGGFAAGSSQELPSYDGENLSKKGDVVVVSLNHRLNVLGFLDLSSFGEKYKSTPNLGMQDIELALRWVKANIANFGGDPNNVTIFGQSGGGGKVSTLMYAPSCKGLFHKGIVQSGYRDTFLEGEDTKQIGIATLEILGLKPEQVDSLQKIPYLQLLAAGAKALKKVEAKMRAEGKPIMGFGLSWGPSRDGAFLPYQLKDPAAAGIAKEVPMMIGSLQNEFMASIMNPTLLTMDRAAIKAELQKKYGDQTDAYIAAAQKAYPTDAQPADLIDLDFTFRSATIKLANLKSNVAGAAPTYSYLFAWRSPVLDGKLKSLHCMELAFCFNNIARCQQMTGGSKEAQKLAEKVSQAWINFARTGNPNAKGLPQWVPYTQAKGATMILDNVSQLKYHHDKELMGIMGLKF